MSATEDELLMDGRGQRCVFEDGTQYIAYFVDWDVPFYAVWKRAADGMYDYVGKGARVEDALRVMLEDQG